MEPVALTCECGKVYKDLQALKQHKRYYCRGIPSPNRDSNSCQYCSRSFNSYIGLRQHIKKAHPHDYNNEVEDNDTVRMPMSAFESLEMVNEELAYEGRHINVHLASIFEHRTEAEIKNHRRTAPYKALLERIRMERDEATNAASPTSDRQDPIPIVVIEDNSPVHNNQQQEIGNSNNAVIFMDDGPEEFSSSEFMEEEAFLSSPPSNAPGHDFEGGQNQPTPPALEHEVRPRDILEPTTDTQTTTTDVAEPTQPDLPTSQQQDNEDFRTYIASLLENIPDLTVVELIVSALSEHHLANQLIDDFIEHLLPRRTIPLRPKSHSNRGRGGNGYRKNAKRAYEYKYAQEMFKKDRASLANNIIEGIENTSGHDTPSLEAIQETYEAIFTTESETDTAPILDRKEHEVHLFRPVLVEEIKQLLKGDISETPGEDGIRLRDVRNTSIHSLCALFNLMLLYGHVPERLRISRTTLIPKSKEGLDDINNWRPITISSIIIRILNKILAARFKSLPYNCHQRGFMSVDGTLANTITLQAIIKTYRKEIKPHSITTLDIRKAFDTVSHHSLLRAMRRFSIEEGIIKFIMSGYDGASTVIKCGEKVTQQIKVNRGVKQGDPLSPYLFNLVMDELLDELEKRRAGLTFNNSSITALAYADDLILFDKNIIEAQATARHCCRFLKKRQMALNPSKCTNLTVNRAPHRKKLYVSTKSRIFVDGGLIKPITVNEQFKYLGFRYSYLGTESPSMQDLPQQLDRVCRAPLKPYQKLLLIKYHLLPRYIFALQNPTITAKTLGGADRLVRLAVKKILHIPKTSANAFLHAGFRAGGLGVLSFATRIPDILLGRIKRLKDNNDVFLRNILAGDFTTHLIEKLQHLLREIGEGRRAADSYWQRKLDNSVSGNGLHQVGRLTESSSWVDTPPQFWTGCDYISAVLLRGNLLPTVGGVHNPRDQRRCRAGCNKSESLSHVLQSCPITHFERIHRHDRVVRSLGKFAQKNGWNTEIEPRFRDGNGVLRKPDLIACKNNNVVIAEVGINWEGPEDLSRAYQGKLTYYSEPGFTAAVKKKYPTSTITIRPFIVGARGGWCALNNKLVEEFNISKPDLKNIVCDVLKGGIICHNKFSIRVWE